MAASVAQSKQNFRASGLSASSLASGDFASSVTAGNVLYVACLAQPGFGTHNAPTDTLGHTYTQIGTTVTEAATGVTFSQWYVVNSSGGTNSITANFATADTGYMGVWGLELGGCKTSGAFDVGAAATMAGDSGADVVDTGNANNTDAPAIMVGVAFDVQGVINNAGTGCTSIATGWDDGGGAKAMAEYKLLATTGSQHLTWSDNAFDRHLQGMAIFLAAPEPVIIPRADYSTFPKYLLQEAAP